MWYLVEQNVVVSFFLILHGVKSLVAVLGITILAHISLMGTGISKFSLRIFFNGKFQFILTVLVYEKFFTLTETIIHVLLA